MGGGKKGLKPVSIKGRRAGRDINGGGYGKKENTLKGGEKILL
jgi:hypothetical protein